MRTPTLRLGPLPPLQVSPGTVVTVLLVAALMYPVMSGPGIAPATSALLALTMGVFLILSVLAHEIAHAVVARAFGARIDHIALTLWGGHTQYRTDRMSSLGSLLVSLSGPATNGVLAALTAAAGALVDPESAIGLLLGSMTWMNLVLAVFNLLPGLPMDGGRALESLLGIVLRSPTTGTVVTAWIGRAIAVGVVLYPLWLIVRRGGAGTGSLLMLVWAMLIAGMLWQGASQALRGATVQRRVETLDAAALARRLRLVPSQTPLAQLGTPEQAAQVLLLDQAGARPGTVGRAFRIDPSAAASVPPEHCATTPASAVAAPLGDVGSLSAHLRGDDLISHMVDHPAALYLVVEEAGGLRGVIMSADVNALLRGR